MAYAPDEMDPQARFVKAIKGMLARPDYLVPLAAAERQFRDHYYGLNSAALLEDLFFDALGSFLRQTSPNDVLMRPPTGQKGWDYAYEGLQISHKVSQTLGDVAALWDATKLGVSKWSFEEPIVYVLGANTPPTSVTIELPDGQVSARSVASLPKPYLADGRRILIVFWPSDGRQPTLLESIATKPGQLVADSLPFSSLWPHVADHVAQGGLANEIDVLITTNKGKPAPVELNSVGGTSKPIGIDVGLRGGVYLLRRELLQDLPVTSNNRAILIPKATIKKLLIEAAERGLFASLPLWYWIYAQERPPDMYSAQRSEFDARFSARGSLDA